MEDPSWYVVKRQRSLFADKVYQEDDAALLKRVRSAIKKKRLEIKDTQRTRDTSNYNPIVELAKRTIQDLDNTISELVRQAEALGADMTKFKKSAAEKRKTHA